MLAVFKSPTFFLQCTYSKLNAVMLQVMANNSILGILSASSLEHQLLEICKASQTVIQNFFFIFIIEKD